MMEVGREGEEPAQNIKIHSDAKSFRMFTCLKLMPVEVSVEFIRNGNLQFSCLRAALADDDFVAWLYDSNEHLCCDEVWAGEEFGSDVAWGEGRGKEIDQSFEVFEEFFGDSDAEFGFSRDFPVAEVES